MAKGAGQSEGAAGKEGERSGTITEVIVSRFSIILVGKVFIKVTETAQLFEVVAKAFNKVIQTAEIYEVKIEVPSILNF